MDGGWGGGVRSQKEEGKNRRVHHQMPMSVIKRGSLEGDAVKPGK